MFLWPRCTSIQMSFFSLMFAMLLVLLPRATSFEYSGRTYKSRQRSTASTTFHDCTFTDCRSSRNGGALYLSSRSHSLDVLGCRFVNCRTTLTFGGAIYVHDSLSFYMNRTFSQNCSASNGSFIRVWVHSMADGDLQLLESCATMCSGRINSVVLLCDSYLSGRSTRVDSVNSSRN